MNGIYHQKSSDKPLSKKPIFIPWLPFSKLDYVWMRINKDSNKTFSMDRVFVVWWDESDLTWEIKIEWSQIVILIILFYF